MNKLRFHARNVEAGIGAVEALVIVFLAIVILIALLRLL